MIGAVSFAVHCERAGAANPFPAIRVERHRFPAGSEQVFVQDVEHLEKRSVWRDVADFVIDEFAAGLRVALSPVLKFEIHNGLRNALIRSYASPNARSRTAAALDHYAE